MTNLWNMRVIGVGSGLRIDTHIACLAHTFEGESVLTCVCLGSLKIVNFLCFSYGNGLKEHYI